MRMWLEKWFEIRPLRTDMLLHKGLLAISDAVLHVALHLRSR